VHGPEEGTALASSTYTMPPHRPILFAAAVLASSLAVLQAGCFSSGGYPCQQLDVPSNTTQGSFTYAYTMKNGTCGGKGSVQQPMNLTSPTSPGYFEVASFADRQIDVSGDYNESIGDAGGIVSFDLNVSNVSAGGSFDLGPTSQICFEANDFDCVGGGVCFDGSDAGAPSCQCATVKGKLTTTSFSTSCISGQEYCALDVLGTIEGTATWSGGSFNVSFDLNYGDKWVTETCGHPWGE